MLEDPEAFLGDFRGRKVVLDEIHRLGNPSEILKIAADHYPDINIIATGSSSLGASRKFRDTLTGRKMEIWLTPMISEDLHDFGELDISRRLARGGLPSFFLSEDYPEREFQEWIDAYWAKDIQELFRLERRFSFQRFTELLFMQSGGIFEATKFAAQCEANRTTIGNYLSVLEATYVVHVVRPFNTRRRSEILSAPKVYGFDTGFVCFHKGWWDLRPDDLGLLWEHYVLNEIQGRLQSRTLRYWRDKRSHEVDFIWPRTSGGPVAIEVKWSAGQFDPAGLQAFRRLYPEGSNFVVCRDVERPYRRSIKDVSLEFIGLEDLVMRLEGMSA
jgi:predicted AAA+ superfamily ATPase